MKKGPGPIDIVIGARIRERREREKLSQQALGEVLGLSFQQIQKYETGKNRVSAVQLVTIANFFKVPHNYFFEDPGGRSVVVTPEDRLISLYNSLPEARDREAVLDIVQLLTELCQRRK